MSGPVTFYPGSRVMVFDYRLFKNDKLTPITTTLKPATVVCWYGIPRARPGRPYSEFGSRFGPYPSLVDVEFDHRPGAVSRGHFTDHTEPAP